MLQDFDYDPELKKGVKDLLEEMVCNTCLLPTEHKAAASVLRVLVKDEQVVKTKIELDELLKPPEARTAVYVCILLLLKYFKFIQVRDIH